MLWAQRVQGSAGRLSCTLEWSERSTRDWPKLRIIEARALVLLLVAGEQSPADYGQFSAFLAVDTHRQASVQPRKKLRYYIYPRVSAHTRAALIKFRGQGHILPKGLGS